VRIENSFIPVRGVGEVTERRLWSEGVTRWAEFDGSAVGPTTADRIESFIAEASARLDDGDVRYFDGAFPDGEHWRLYEDFRPDTCFLDIETTGLDPAAHRVTTVSVHRGGETETLVRGEDLTAERLREQFADAALVATFNGKCFDIPFLEQSFDVDVDLPHVDLMYACRRLGLSGGLKAVERAVDIERDRLDLSGRDAVRLWRRYERGDEGALDTLVSYNRDDAANLEALMERATDALHEQTVGELDAP